MDIKHIHPKYENAQRLRQQKKLCSAAAAALKRMRETDKESKIHI